MNLFQKRPNNTHIPEVSSIKVLGFLFDSGTSWVDPIVGSNTWVNSIIANHFLVLRVLSLLINLGFDPHWNVWYFACTLEQLSLIWSIWTAFRPASRTMCGVTFPSLTAYCNASILGLTCHLLAGVGRGNLLSFFCPQSKSSSSRTSNCLHNFDPANHLHFQNPCNFRTFFVKAGKQQLLLYWPANLMLLGHSNEWRSFSRIYNDSPCMLSDLTWIL